MELFGIYVIGMVLIGFPVGKWSLRVWKNPKNYRNMSRVLFPLNSARNMVGKRVVEAVMSSLGWEEYDNLPMAMGMFNVHDGLHNNDPLPQAQYILLQMMVWPIRITYILVAPIAIKSVSIFKKCAEI
jgi:hypothetical protein